MTSDVIDASVYNELKEAVGADFAVELVTAFLEEAPGMFTELSAAQGSGDADGFRRAAHSIKSNAEVFGATVLAAQARDIELADMTDDAAVVAALQTTFDQTATALKGMLDE